MTASVCHNHIAGTQFHPEKSGKAGLILLRKFMEKNKIKILAQIRAKSVLSDSAFKPDLSGDCDSIVSDPVAKTAEVLVPVFEANLIGRPVWANDIE